MTASGSAQLSYWAASTRKTNTTASTKANIAVEPVWSCKNASSVHWWRIACGRLSRTQSSICSMAWPELTPARASR